MPLVKKDLAYMIYEEAERVCPSRSLRKLGSRVSTIDWPVN